MQRKYDVIHRGTTSRRYVNRTDEGQTVLSEELGQVRGHPHRHVGPREAALIDELFKSEQTTIPTLNLDAPELTGEDASAIVELDRYFSDVLDSLSKAVPKTDFAYLSQHQRLVQCASLATQWIELGRKAEQLKRQIEAACAEFESMRPVSRIAIAATVNGCEAPLATPVAREEVPLGGKRFGAKERDGRWAYGLAASVLAAMTYTLPWLTRK